jgi:fibronectin type 3 domain-containing protein
MAIVLGVRAAGVWIALAATALLAACGGGGGGTGTTGATPTGVTSATISWLPPTQNTDGSGVGPLSGYKIYYGTASKQYTTTIPVSNAGLTTYVVDGLNRGATYYFVVTAVTAAGIESALSPEVAAMIS